MKLQRRYPKTSKRLKTSKSIKRDLATSPREGCENIAMKRSKSKHK